jgi:hypothetical protein
VNFGHTFANIPVCTGSTAFATTAVGVATSTSQATIQLSAGGTALGQILILCRGY